MADFDSCLSSLGDVDTDVLKKMNAAATRFSSVAKKIRPDQATKKTRELLKKNNLKVVPFDKDIGFCILSNTDYHEKLDAVTSSPQFTKVKSTDGIVLKTEMKFNRALQRLHLNGKISSEVLQKIPSCGDQPARLYGLAKVQKESTPLRPVLSLPGRV